VVADTYGRRRSVIIGTLIIGAAFLLEGARPLVWLVLLAEAIRGFGWTFLSGALDAWLADEAGEQALGAVYLRSGQIARLCSLAGIGVGVALTQISLAAPVLAGGVVYLLAAVGLIWRMPETQFRPLPRSQKRAWDDLRATLRGGAAVLRARPVLLTLLLVNLIGGAASEGFDRLWEAHLLTGLGLPQIGNLSAPAWFGLINAAGLLLTLAITELLLKRLERLSQAQPALAAVLAVSNLLAAGLTLGFALAGSFWAALGLVLLRSAVMAIYNPLYSTWLARNIDSQVRATVISITSQSNALGQVAGGPWVGALAESRSLRAALSVAAVLLTPASLLFAAIRNRREPAAQPAES
jgi:DHA3 family tetracycline resistance protein-like MFS transporter